MLNMFVTALLCLIALNGLEVNCQYTFPDDFLFGVATASYQVEGGWNADGKGENIWDRTTHEHPDWVVDGSNGDVACDTYHHVDDDIQRLVDLGVDFYRFSISWSRILPLGTTDIINNAGIDYYNTLIDGLIANDIIPLVTLYHWDLPQPLQDIGGWPNPVIADHFVNYSRIAFQNFGDRVKMWLTFNEPKQTCLLGYGDGSMAPGLHNSGIDDYACTHTLLQAHGRAWHLYDEEFRPTQQGRISITVDTAWEQAYSNDTLDLEAQEREIQFNFGWFANPIFSSDGNYPQVMIDRVAARSAAEGFAESRLPAFTEEEVNSIRGTYDFLGINIYTTNLVAHQDDPPIGDISYYNDKSTAVWQDDSWPGSAADWLKVTPWGARDLLNWIRDRYQDPEIYITENGFADLGELEDVGRIDFYTQYLNAILEAIFEDGVNVKGYTAWSFLDNFEWMQGYSQKYGLYQVDFNDPARTRTPKRSLEWYREVLETHQVPIINRTISAL